MKRSEQDSRKVNRRDALKGLAGFAAIPLFAEPASGEQGQRGVNVARASEVMSLSTRLREQSLDLEWRFFRGDVAGAEHMRFDDSKWRRVDLPHDWSIEDLVPTTDATGEGTIWVGGNTPTRIGPFDMALSAGQEATGWVVGGTGWYRKHFLLPATDRRAQAEVRFDGVYMNSEVWINGQSLGTHPYGYTSFAYDLTPFLKQDGENVLAVRVRNEGANSRWYSGSGIYRHVWLTLTGEVRIPLWGIGVTTPKYRRSFRWLKFPSRWKTAARFRKVLPFAPGLLGHTGNLRAPGRKRRIYQPAANPQSLQSLDVKPAQLWSSSTPQLYRAEIELVVAGKAVDRSAAAFGIRSIEVDIERGLRINGEQVKLKGGCVHHDNGILGAPAFDRAEERRVEILKANGFNAIRTSHNPPSAAFLDACDRLGMMVIDEAFDCWNLGKNVDDYHLYFEDWWERDLKSMLMRDRNHPSVIFWSIGNEIDGRREPIRSGNRQRAPGRGEEYRSDTARHHGGPRAIRPQLARVASQ